MQEAAVRDEYRVRITRWYEGLSASRQGEIQALKSLLNP
jgi:hypothetical protein